MFQPLGRVLFGVFRKSGRVVLGEFLKKGVFFFGRGSHSLHMAVKVQCGHREGQYRRLKSKKGKGGKGRSEQLNGASKERKEEATREVGGNIAQKVTS